MSPKIFPRKIRSGLLESLSDTRVVFVVGARQVGKTTLVTEVTDSEYPMNRFTLDDQVTRDAALRDPTGFVAGLEGPALIDEVQRAPDLLLAIKNAVDTDNRPGRFLLTGSANILATKKVRDALTGRVETVKLWPLSQIEIEEGHSNFIDALFTADLPRVVGAPVGREAFVTRVTAGGYPEARLRSQKRRSAWFENYLASTLDRDLRDISDALKIEAMPQLLRLLASQAANVLTYRSVAQKLELHPTTTRAYVGLLEQLSLVHRIPGWRPGLGARESTKPKVYINDSGLLCHLLGADSSRLANDDQVTGKAFENFVVMELLRFQGWSDARTTLYHYQRDREDIDLIIERADGSLVAVEVKASATVRPKDYRWLEKLRNERSEKFIAGVVICTTDQTTPLGDRLWACPVSSLWQ